MNPLDNTLPLYTLTVKWWIRWRDFDPIRTALIRARANHIDGVISSALKKNKENGSNPKTLAELAEDFSRDTVNLWRLRAGESEPSLGDIYSLAEILQLPVHEFLQTHTELLASATQILCKPEGEPHDERGVNAHDAIIYAEYLTLPRPAKPTPPDYAAVTQKLSSRNWRALSTKDIARSISKIVKKLEPILTEVSKRSAQTSTV